MTRSRLWPLLVTPTLLLTLAACGGNDDKSSDLPTIPPSSSSTLSTPPSSASPTPTKPTAVPTQTTAKYRDLTLVLNRPAAVDAKAGPIVLLFQQVHQLFAVMAGGQSAPAELSKIADPSAVKYLNEILAADRKAKQHAGGTLTVSVTKVQPGTTLAVVDGCFNQSKVVTIRPDGSRFVDPSIGRNPALPVRMTLSRGTGIWKISDYAFRDGKC
ncbi:hypothetical protein [Streptomyces sp. SID13031]|uniref:hypothetical protein n=1 Tax=Streptomyces sp. SID13031 TaxID=2706046 RepID=UPI0013CDDDE9|nr:hypothetical protein [Streptomyces sp. SID13031]NEA31527.1 hypothetical protein [Streptomyces sp. SID13031]